MKRRLFLLVTAVLAFTGCSKEPEPQPKPNMLIYCGITMIQPMKVLAQEFEKTHSVEITLTQGGSQDLYDSIKLSKTGDLYLPGSPNYRLNNLKDGILLDAALVGYNRVALMVQKGNPKNIPADLNQLINPNLSSVLSNPQTGSIGKASQKALENVGIYDQAYSHAVYLTTDSRRLIQAMKNKEADLTLNWYAAGVWPQNKDYVDILELPDEVSEPKKLEISLLKYSKNPSIAQDFMAFASGPRGREVFKEYGFLTKKEYDALMDNSGKQAN